MPNDMTTPTERRELFRQCMQSCGDTSMALENAAAIVRFIDHGEYEAQMSSWQLPGPSIIGKPMFIGMDYGTEVHPNPADDDAPDLGQLFEPEADIGDGADDDVEPDEEEPAADVQDEEPPAGITVAWRAEPVQIERLASGLVKWTDANTTLLQEALRHGGVEEAERVFGLKASSIRVKATRLGFSTVPNKAWKKEEPTRAAPTPAPVRAPKVEDTPVITLSERRDGQRHRAIFWLEKNNYVVQFSEGAFDAWLEEDDDVGVFGVTEAELLQFARDRGWKD
ncbi:MAG: hypothetical protein HQL35_04840 [Alphaproteobacteria bacterium]|nr:hypothetical protein [Alphaproteobacteria bacterium]